MRTDTFSEHKVRRIIVSVAKYTYNQAFAIYALSAYYRLTGDEEALALARELFSLIEEKAAADAGYSSRCQPFYRRQTPCVPRRWCNTCRCKSGGCS